MFCPNINDKNYQALASIVGEARAHTIWNMNNGNPITHNSDGSISKIYQTLESKYGDKRALAMRVKMFSDEFMELSGVTNNNTDIKSGVLELFESNPELANAVYSKLLTNPDISAENLLSLLEQENIIEKDCSGGKLKAKDGIRSKFTKGSQWEIYEIFEGKSHKQGGIEINIKNNQINFTNKNGSIKAKYGLVISKDS